MNRTKIRLLLVDDHLVVRIGLRSLLEEQPDMTIVGEAAGGHAAVTAFCKCHPDVTLMDLRMPDLSGPDTATAIRKLYPKARVLMLTTFDNDEDIYRAVEAGAAGYLLKSADGHTLTATIRAIYAGTYQLPADLEARLAQRRGAPELSPRELEVLQLIARGHSNKSVGAVLGLTENTVKNHVKMILEKLRVADRTQAATTALQRGLVKMG